jgi:hypothetical protein
MQQTNIKFEVLTVVSVKGYIFCDITYEEFAVFRTFGFISQEIELFDRQIFACIKFALEFI